MALLVVAGTAAAVWMAVETVFVNRWEREERANHAAREREGRPPGLGDPTGSAQSVRGGRNGTGGV